MLGEKVQDLIVAAVVATVLQTCEKGKSGGGTPSKPRRRSTEVPEVERKRPLLEYNLQFFAGKNGESSIESGSNAFETPIFTGKSKPWESGATPNSIYEQLNPDGTVKSRAFYDESGRWFNRQDFDHDHFDKKTQMYYQPHEHSCHYNQNGYRDGIWDGPLTPGYNNLPTQ